MGLQRAGHNLATKQQQQLKPQIRLGKTQPNLSLIFHCTYSQWLVTDTHEALKHSFVRQLEIQWNLSTFLPLHSSWGIRTPWGRLWDGDSWACGLQGWTLQGNLWDSEGQGRGRSSGRTQDQLTPWRTRCEKITPLNHQSSFYSSESLKVIK